jgi:hypothetical protein
VHHQVVEDNILKYAPAKKGSRFEDKLATVMLRRDVIEKLQEAERNLRPIFSFYINQQEWVHVKIFYAFSSE